MDCILDMFLYFRNPCWNVSQKKKINMKLRKEQPVDVLVTADYPPGFELEFEGHVKHAKKGEQIVIGANGAITWNYPLEAMQLPRKPMIVYLQSIHDEQVNVTCSDDLPYSKHQYLYSEISARIQHPNGTSFDLTFKVTFKEGKVKQKKVYQIERELRKILNYTGPIQTK
jgi:hypothetical protein